MGKVINNLRKWVKKIYSKLKISKKILVIKSDTFFILKQSDSIWHLNWFVLRNIIVVVLFVHLLEIHIVWLRISTIL